MIATLREYHHARREAEAFEQALRALDAETDESTGLSREAMRRAFKGDLATLRKEMAEFDAVRSGSTATVTAHSLPAIVEAVILARTANGLTQQQLADKLGLKAQQIQRWERTRFAGVSAERVQDVADALGVTLECTLSLSCRPVAGRDGRRD